MSKLGKQLQALDERSKKLNTAPVSVGQVLTIQPISIAFNGLIISVANGDTIYINDLMLDENIDLDVGSMDEKQEITQMLDKADEMFAPWIAQYTPCEDYKAHIDGTQKQFVIDFYEWVKAVHNRYIIHVGDYVGVQKLGNNTYLVLQKLQRIGNDQ